MKKDSKNNKPIIAKQDFIKFLASATPEEINNYIAEKGKPARLVEPLIFIDAKTKNNDLA